MAKRTNNYEDQRLQESNSKIIRWFGFDQFVPEQAVTSYWVSSKTFLLIRVPILLYTTIVIWTDLGVSAAEGGGSRFFGYFTTLTFVGLHAYIVTSVVHHVRYLMQSPHRPSSFLDQPAWINYLYVWLYHTVVTFNIVTPVVYWSLLAGTMLEDGATPLNWWLTGSVHAVSFFLMMTDMIFGRVKFFIRQVITVLCTVILYMFLSFIIHASTGWWVYPFLDWSNGRFTALWYFAVAIGIVVIFFIQFFFHWLRDRIALGKPRSSTLDSEANDIQEKD
ncbi:hypothetical protein J3Q64DRAFT_1746805 [Phycomyces blakesleeanus]|uniref:Uncharacterized protein n=2 Tax=Phycomyces blakesleeanus TaxID=4837 RepID=A0A167MAZ2_PHYB8|nr:hypothetical protein PHYBLDRAFT_146520 [Phycomyces blakesleeanus NRRL 1555(-)]OAD72319.1 hypothetical protein PHYBLDRAFT_146520 [Phycomyces blakesleeanus NRRL 1555(-)]|eukprot:XP_018290359.1 hypothetical protein PHYBLDRAFT_146520 [Phycomyces blakesleeanus NRRL 1555(-)]